MPDIAHAAIASFLPDGNYKKGNRLRFSEVSRALLVAYGGTLTCATLRNIDDDGNAARLAALLRRQHKLNTVYVAGEEAIPAFSQAIAYGCCRGVRSIHICDVSSVNHEEHLSILAEAIRVDGALPVLKVFSVSFSSTPRVLSKLTEVLDGGALPLLEHLDMKQKGLTDDKVNLMADVMEKRAHIPDYHKLKTFDVRLDGNVFCWLNSTSPGTKRLLRALLPSIQKLGYIRWSPEFDPCFHDVRPLFLKELHTGITNEAFPSLEGAGGRTRARENRLFCPLSF